MLNPSGMRGLSTFISDLRACRSREQEEKRINKELGNIRSKLKEGSLNSYQKKKYVCKLLYIYLLGNEIDFGHVEAVNLITANKYTEKQIGYLGVTLLISENDDLVRLVINSMRKDLEDRQEVFNCLALQAISNLGSREIAEVLTDDVFKLLVSTSSINFVKKKACLCLLRLYRKHPDTVPITDWATKICAIMDDYDVGVNMCLASLIIGLAGQHHEILTSVIPLAINKLHSIVIDKMFTPDNVYYHVPAPWLQVKLCRLLQSFPPIGPGAMRDKLNVVIRAIFATANEIPKNAQHNNAINAVVVEAINLALHIDPDSDLVPVATNLSARYVVSKEINMKYLGLEIMTKLATFPQCLETIKKHREGVFIALADKDISVRRNALDLLYTMCDTDIAKQVVEELLSNLAIADYMMKEDMVLKIAILTERFAEESTWYVDVTLKMIDVAGEHVSNEVWHRVVQIITNNATLHAYSAKQVMAMLQNPVCNEFIVKVSAYILGEYGDLIANDTGSNPLQQFTALNSKFGLVSPATRRMLLNTYVKFVNIFPEIKGQCMRVFQQHVHSLDAEIQQRACEYMALASLPSDDLLQTLFEQMPPFPARESALIQRLKLKEVAGDDGELSTGRERRGVAPTAAGAEMANAMKTVNAAAPKSNPSADLLGLDDLSTPTPSNSGGFGMSAALTAHQPASNDQIANWFFAFIQKPGGIFYEDSALQIGIKTEYSAATGRLTLFIGNKGQTPINGLSIDIGTVEGLACKLIDPVQQLAPMAQLQQVIAVQCSGAFSLPPEVQIKFHAGTNIQLPKLLLPVFVSKFTDPVAMAGTDYLNRWKMLGTTKEIQAVVKAGTAPIQIANVKSLLESLNMGILGGVDPNPNNFVCASVVQTASSGKIGCLLRVETNVEQAMFRVTLRATSEAVLKPVSEFIKTCLGRVLK
eukprot:Partr_v1_DN28168_c0_g2_i2_m55082 putative Adaptor-related protein complex 2, alpha